MDVLHTTKLTSYHNPRRANDLLRSTKIWQAVRATSAAPTFFEPQKLGPYSEFFLDGGTGANNPIRELWGEAADLWRDLGSLNDTVQCIVSIGTGVSASSGFGDSFIDVAKALKKLAIEKEKTAEHFEREHFDLLRDGRYFRLNVSNGLGGIGLQETSKIPQVAAATRAYLSSETVSAAIERCAERLRNKQG
jgi:hypothetical protein